MEMTLLAKAESFLTQFYTELALTGLSSRLDEVRREIAQTGAYTHTTEELAFGARVAWRNSNRCIGRLFWNSMNVLDRRDATTEEAVMQALVDHIDYATNGGKIRPAVTIFQPERNGEIPVKIYNHQLIRYAGYKNDRGEIAGDPHSVPFTAFCESLGWKGNGGEFDLLPLVVEVNGQGPSYYEIPSEKVLEVEMSHPHFDWFQALNLKWYAVPIISEMKLEIGGINYVAAPFNGWYMETEIGARNFSDEKRYNMLPAVAKNMGLDTTLQSTLWKDRALIELNTAVLHSFKEAGVSIVDHHTAAVQFKRFQEREEEAGREVTGDWTWLISPLSPATSHVFHQSYNNEWKSPNFFYQPSFYEEESKVAKTGCPFLAQQSSI